MSYSCQKISDFVGSACPNVDVFLCRYREQILSDKVLMAALYNQYKNYLFSSAKKIVNRYPGIELEELVNEGFEGILRALEKYNCNEASFLTYAQHWVRMKMVTASRKSIGPMALPGSMYTIISKVKAISDKSPELTDKQMAAIIRESPERVSIAVSIIKSPKAGSAASIEDIAEQEEVSHNLLTRPSMECDLINAEFSEKFWACIEDIVTPKECFVLGLLFGRGGKMRRSLEWVAKVLYVSKERIRQIKEDAFGKIRLSDDMKQFIDDNE